MAFTATNKLPGVYIDEIDVAGPIAGVATSVLALIGPAKRGPINRPTQVTNLTQFNDRFGQPGEGPHFTAPRFYASHAVHGFFENGGSSCYFVRAGTAANASQNLVDRAAAPNATLVVEALEEGVVGNSVQVEVQAANIATTQAQRGEALVAAGGAANNAAAVDDGNEFAIGDVVLFDDGGGTTEQATVIAIAGNDLTFGANLANAFAAGDSVRVADLAAGRTSFRVADTTGLEPGSHVAFSQAAVAEQGVVDAVDSANHVITLAGGLANSFEMTGADSLQVRSLEFTLLFNRPATADSGPVSETFSDLAMDSRHSQYFAPLVAAGSQLVSMALADNPPNPTPPPDNLPAVVAATNLGGGANDDPSALGAGHYQAAIDALERVDAATMLSIPDRTDAAVQAAMITHCERMQDRFAILDPQLGAGPMNGIRAQRSNLNSDRGYAALYYPRISISNPDPKVGGQILVPPSGHIAGVFARTDDTKGVHKAPANEQIRGVLDLERSLNDTEAGQLNELSVNVLRRVPNAGFRVWGARTLTQSTQWRYVNVRRLLLFIEESIQEGTEFAVFEPNNRSLWETVKRQINEFLTTIWANGAFVGPTPEDSFRVRVDEELNPPGQIALGILTFEVIVYPAPPAEFIIFRVIQEPGGPRLEEV